MSGGNPLATPTTLASRTGFLASRCCWPFSIAALQLPAYEPSRAAATMIYKHSKIPCSLRPRHKKFSASHALPLSILRDGSNENRFARSASPSKKLDPPKSLPLNSKLLRQLIIPLSGCRPAGEKDSTSPSVTKATRQR